MARLALLLAAQRHPCLPSFRSRRQCQGISLVELLIGVVISIVVLGASVRLLVSLIRSDSATQLELNRKDEVGRVLGLMQDEIRNAQRVESGSAASPLARLDTTRCPTNGVQTILILRGVTANEDISYGLLSASNATWRGPAVLVRCGPPYNAAGALNAGTIASPNRSEQVVVDTLCTPTTTGCNPLSGFSVDRAANSVTRNVQLNLNSVVSGTRLSSSVQVPITTNQIYGLVSNSATGTCTTGCADPNGETIHYRPNLANQTITGSPSLEDVFYFDLSRSAYTLSGTSGGQGLCTRDQCSVSETSGGSRVTFTDGDVLVFRDLQIRL